MEISASDSVRDVLAQHPATAAVFARHGIAGCGGAAGPNERLDVFAAAHRVALETLLAELNEAAKSPQAAAAPAATATEAEALYRPYILAALLSTLTLGATYGALNLLAIHLGATFFPYWNNPVHGSFQLYGFVLLFILGVAFHALPRFLSTPLEGRVGARLALPLLLVGLFARAAGLYFGEERWTAHALTAGGALLSIGVAVAAASLWRTIRRSSAPHEPWVPWLAFGTGWWLVSALLLTGGGLHALLDAPLEAFYWNEPAYVAALYGGCFSFIGGMLWRLGPAFLGMVWPSARASVALLAAAQLGVTTSVAGALARGLGPWWGDGVLLAGQGIFAAAVVAYCWKTRLFARRRERSTGDESLRFSMRVAFGFALAYAAVVGLHLGLELFDRSNHLIVDAGRHAFAQGFVGLAILVVGSRILPIFGGVDLAWARAREWAVLAIAVGIGLRMFEILAALGWPAFLAVSGTSGLIAGTGVAMLALSLVVTVLRKPVERVRRGPAPLELSTRVSELLEDYPMVLGVLIGHGFAPLANPVARRTLARMVTLEQACRMQGKDPERVIADVRRAVLSAPCPATPARAGQG